MDFTTFATLVFIASIVTSAITEAVKKLNVFKSNNILAALISVIVGIGTSVFYAIFTGIASNGTYIAMSLLLVLASWLCAMIGYDKVKQIIDQIKGATN